ncbi:MAG TPA: ABC transporter permease [Vicinamibacteria bacterium]|nr:ABC transporter permease [Vicinamibacteria bacterium]
MITVSIFAPWLTRHSPEDMDMEARLSGPSASHWLGTDNFGRDLWTRIAFGSRISLTIALSSVAAALLLGTLVGLASGYFGGLLDLLLMGIVDLFLAFPPFILALALVAVLGPGVSSVTLALTAIFWTEYARLVRAITLSESRRDYVTAARSLGATHANVLFRQILPRAFGPLAVLATLGIGTAIVAESGLSFLGFGVEPPAPTWGWTLAYGMRYLRSHMWLSTVPGLAILVTVLGFNLFGDGLRDRLDPRGLVRSSPPS